MCCVTKSNNARCDWLHSSHTELICCWSVLDRDKGYTGSCSWLQELYAEWTIHIGIKQPLALHRLGLFYNLHLIHMQVFEAFLNKYSWLAPSYLSETLHLSTEVDARRRLRFASTSTLVVPSTRRSTLGDRAFPVAAARAWNSLSPSVRSTSSLASFYLHLKTHLFTASFPRWHSTPS